MRLHLGVLMQIFFVYAYFIIGTVQLIAAIDGVRYLLGVGTIVSFFIAIFVNYIPIVGSFLGYYGAHNAWHWNVYASVGLCFWYVPVLAIAILLDVWRDRQGKAS